MYQHRKFVRTGGDVTDQLEALCAHVAKLRREKAQLAAEILESRGRSPIWRERMQGHLASINDEIHDIEGGCRP